MIAVILVFYFTQLASSCAIPRLMQEKSTELTILMEAAISTQSNRQWEPFGNPNVGSAASSRASL
jgi:hypothetical protein